MWQVIMGMKMKVSCLFLALALAASSLRAQAPASARRDKAVAEIQACLKRNQFPSRECKNLDKNAQILEELYRDGDKSGLPTLLHITYLNLSDFYREALVADPEGFLLAVSNLSDRQHKDIAGSISGGLDGLTRERFDAVHAALMTVSESSPYFNLARMCRVQLETDNAFLLHDYFPPTTLVSPTGNLKVHLLSSELHALEEKPMWPPAPGGDRTYRVLVSCAFGPPESVTLTARPDGSGEVQLRRTDAYRQHPTVGASHAVNPEQVKDFLRGMDGIQFWQLPTEPVNPQIVLDGCDWILEGVEDGRYHIVDWTCPGDTPFGRVTRKLFELSGHESKGVC
ncbi:MAG TPA: hypothetical protein VFM21_10775 [Terriglobia bacterium]|nr:hypothetical protein [Terriglobia bacterium]